MFKPKDIGIDLGTVNVLIYVKDKGIVLTEPAVVAIDKDTKKVLAVGKEAYNMIGKTPGSVITTRPLKDGVIADFTKAEIMLNFFIKKLNIKRFFFKPRIVICCPSNITQVEKNAIKEIAERTGASKIYLEYEPKAAALGSGLLIDKPGGNMIIDIGGGTTDIAILSLNGLVYGESIKIAGNTFDNDIIKYIKNKYKLLIGEVTSEKIKIKIATAQQIKDPKIMKIKGRDLTSGLPKTISVNSNEINEAINDSLYIIIHTIKSVLEKIEPEVSSDIIDKGILITGGSALIPYLDKLIEKEIKVSVKISKNPLTCVALGTGIILDNLD